ncbi:type II toxin-antitoxin system RelE/ParE family toxin [Alkalinema sp. FACHB-956]|uniref:type II toxin-antitoxin system RelE family toxin n=1 Tax=Alkalinema sp. FACHB-956 TaxID=2692768 RepID=UPI0016857C30|nr:type II toxin-antitoxin system RelE/ParE family toxin [Alkalinema sp. FACHB-956]MBD2328497.1 type II toxin-antitoxin system RelE/ParE family toxin [Alkalinema sp. FACHB-956]
MTYQVTVPKAVQKQIDALPLEILDRVAEIIQDLAENPRPNGVTKLKGSDRTYRLRVSDYRIVYDIYDKE